ncbi:MAG TPA: molybdenum cofactor biosynthesis protein MoaE [Candidatus Agrococcus pullicola]|uniref:Molybdenum cofactor biosynthesis protein MoaE n=1 Tax=Candidatus Agrococcus pullicola TaxID=2838429 RepID=A0A9D1YY93_9MICO|nr:molybdenum cofactor biosynthesis protein MoaE [Candidatus Agrococcus pullicola]
MTSFALVTPDELDEAAVRAAVTDDAHGAVIVFHGVVRDHDGGRGVSALEYSAHPDAERLLRECLRAPEGVRLAAAHRTGTLTIGDTALIAAASSAHRPEAFAALESLVTRIKAEVPIWKRQHFTDGATEWVGL